MLSSSNTAVKQPRCLLDRWCAAIHEASVQNHDGGPVPYCDDANIARTVLDFLFAAQDATNSALTFALDVLDAHRDVWEELCRCETVEKDEGAYAARLANQLLHHKPPVPMICADGCLWGWPAQVPQVPLCGIAAGGGIAGPGARLRVSTHGLPAPDNR
jgi:hypothetical protein